MIRHLIAVLILALLTSRSQAVEIDRPAGLVRLIGVETITVPGCQGNRCQPQRRDVESAMASGVVVGFLQLDSGRHYVVLTCEHVLKSGPTRWLVIDSHGRHHGVHVTYHERGLDLAVITYQTPDEPSWSRIEPLRISSEIALHGWGNGRPTQTGGHLLAQPQPDGSRFCGGLMLRRAPISGESGGGLWTSSGLIGLVCGYTQIGSQTHAAWQPSPVILEFLRRLPAPLHGQSALRPAQQPGKAAPPSPTDVSAPVARPDAGRSTPKRPPPAIEQHTPSSGPPDVAERSTPATGPTPLEQSPTRALTPVIGLAGWALTALQWAGVASIAGASTGGLGWGVFAIARLLSRRRRSSSGTATAPTPAPAPHVVTVQSEPPPQAVYRETRFTPVETDRFAQAFAWAVAELVSSNPGARGTVEYLQSLIKQHMSGPPTSNPRN